MTATRTAFLAALDTTIKAKAYSWANDPHPRDASKTRHEFFLGEVALTLSTDRNVVNIDSPSFVEAWRAIGMKGRPTYKALRALAA